MRRSDINMREVENGVIIVVCSYPVDEPPALIGTKTYVAKSRGEALEIVASIMHKDRKLEAVESAK